MPDAEVKKRIVIASVLKPVNDTRMTAKIGNSLASTGKFDIQIIGYPSGTDHISPSGLTTHPLPHFKRLSFKRMQMSWKIRSKIISLKPDILIICTHELIVPAVIVKMVTGCKLVYDVQENYYRNIRYTNAFPPVVRNLVAGYVRFKEWIFASAIDHFFLAEKSYPDEMSFFGKRFTILENKIRKASSHPRKDRDTSKLLFSGTLSESSGVFVAIDLAIQLHAIDPTITLVIIGHCAQQKELDRIKSRIPEHSYIRLIGGDRLVPHEAIVKEIENAGAGIISYPPNPSTRHSTPTKLFEYLGNALPIVLINNPVWVKRCRPYHAAVVFDMLHSESRNLYYSLKNTRFYPNIPTDVFWESEESTLFQIVNQLL